MKCRNSYYTTSIDPKLFCLTHVTGGHQVHAHDCTVGREKDAQNHWHWVLSHEDPCACTSISFGGWNMVPPERSYDPVYVEKQILSANVEEIRMHYSFKCEGKKTTNSL